MKVIKEYDFSYEVNESFEDAIKELNKAKEYLNSSINGTIANTAEFEIDVHHNKFVSRFWMAETIVMVQEDSWDDVINSFIIGNDDKAEETNYCEQLKNELLKQAEKLEQHIKKMELKR